MKISKNLSIFVALFMISGCSAPIVAWKGRPFGEHRLDPKQDSRSRLYVVTAERRLGILVPIKDWDMRFCAESLPEAAVGQSAKSSLDLSDGTKASGTNVAKIAGEVNQSLTKTFERTERAELLRQLGWQLCQAWAQGVLDKDEYKEALLKLTGVGEEALKLSQPKN